MIEICSKEKCTGCSACADGCPFDAISMDIDESGFYRPKINQEICVECRKCVKICPAIQPPEVNKKTTAYIYQTFDKKIQFESTSGGFFSKIAEMVLEREGIVCGAAYNDKMELCHMFASQKEQLNRLRKSKYVQSKTEGVFREVEKLLDEKYLVLFVGLPCQVAGLSNFLRKGYDNLILVDLVCYGVPSPGIFASWISYLESKYSKVKNVVFREKSYGYMTPNIRVYLENGKFIENCRDASVYSHWFFRNLTVRESCFSCQFKTVGRVSDLTLGDLWLAKEYGRQFNDKGATAVFAHSDKGRRLCEQFCDREVDLDYVVKTDGRKLQERAKRSVGYENFQTDYQNKSFDEMMDKYEPDSMKGRLKYFVKGIMNKTGVSNKILKRKKRMVVKNGID